MTNKTNTRRNWHTTGDLELLISIMEQLIADGKELSSKVVAKHMPQRQSNTINMMMGRLELARIAGAYKGDCEDKYGNPKPSIISRVNKLRAALVAGNIKVEGNLVITKILHKRTGSPHGSIAAPRTGSAGINTNTNFTGVFELIQPKKEEQHKLNRWLDIKVDAERFTYAYWSALYGKKLATIKRYFGGGAGYENGPPIKFIAFVESHFAPQQ